jgi:hypothetical protein
LEEEFPESKYITMVLVTDLIRLPELESLWPWPRMVNPYLAEIEPECLEWSASFGAFDAEAQKLIHDKGKLSKFQLPSLSHEMPTVLTTKQISWLACATPG